MSIISIHTVFDVITDFLVSESTSEANLAYRLPPDLEQRALKLLVQRRERPLTSDEELDMYDFIRADDIMMLLKAKTRSKHAGKT